MADSSGNCTITRIDGLVIRLPGLIFFFILAVTLVVQLILTYRRKIKNNFLQRSLVYTSLAGLISLAVLSVHTFDYFDQHELSKRFCIALHTILYCFVFAGYLAVFSRYIVLTYKVYHSVFGLCKCKWTGNDRYKVGIESFFVIGILSITVIISYQFAGKVQDGDQHNQWLVCFEETSNHIIADCNHETQSTTGIAGIVLLIFNFCITVVCIYIMVVVLVYLKKRQTQRGYRKICKTFGRIIIENILFYCIYAIGLALSFTNLNNQIKEIIAFYIYVLGFMVPTIVFFLDMCASLCQGRKEVPATHTNPGRTGYETCPLSTRISLPTDTAAHSPNFLSPSTAEPTDTALLIIN